MSRDVIVEAEDWEAASKKVSDAYHAGDIILGSDDNCKAVFKKSYVFWDEPIVKGDERLKYFPEIERELNETMHYEDIEIEPETDLQVEPEEELER